MFKNLIQNAADFGCSVIRKGKSLVAAGLAAVGIGSVAAPKAEAAIVLTDFTTALGDVGTAVTGALGTTVTAGLAIAGVIMGGMLLWRLFRKIAGA